MGKVYYRPNKNKSEANGREKDSLSKEEKIQLLNRDELEEVQSELGQSKEQIKMQTSVQLENVKAIGDVDCDYHIYLEDYVYTYLYQYAQMDLNKESAAVFVGKFSEESKEIIISGIIPLRAGKDEEREWLIHEALEEAEKERQTYFSNQEIIGWMHMQPGYGTMLTMKELREHRNVFGSSGKVFMLLDPINKIETFYALEGDELLEQSGYYMYYQRNEEMQHYMIEHAFKTEETAPIEDTVVNQFREIGRARKKEYIQRKNLNVTVVATSVLLIALTAVVVKMNGTQKVLPTFAQDTPTINVLGNDPIGESDNSAVQFTINQVEKQALSNEEKVTETNKEQLSETQTNGLTSETTKEQVRKDVNVQFEKEEVKKEEAKKEESEKEEIKYDTYVIQEGDTLANIVYKQYGNSSRIKEIIDLNNLSNTNLIKVGQELKLPKQ
ncbi:LysM peptidoglycan-binding domain-containing protein [Sporanaerobium hydrogeniformans]|uniref:LysM peptidoglycan-binding domain-containing protein n=1 Tax=Sporanaerobium hydrogeniformans TaxID=3072179 RepID=UPI000C12A926|nr:LysM domain-containing protein [Sporanaerobium hydrogeniformans]